MKEETGENESAETQQAKVRAASAPQRLIFYLLPSGVNLGTELCTIKLGDFKYTSELQSRRVVSVFCDETAEF